MQPLAALIWTPGVAEMVVLLVIIMMFFGVGKLPEVGNALGKSLRAFKDGQKPGALDALDVTPSATELDSSTDKQKDTA